MQNKNAEDVIELDLQELFGFLLHWLWLILLCGFLAGGAGFMISRYVVTPQYQSTTKVYILNRQDNSTLTYSDVQLGTQLTKDYAQLIKGRYVLEQVIEICKVDEKYETFAKRVSVETLTDTRIIAITVEDENPMMAQFIADEIRKVASEHIKNVMDIQAVNVAEEANLPEAPSSPSIAKWTGAGFLVGIFLCSMLLLIRFLVDDTIKTSDDIEKYLGLSTLAMIPVIESSDRHKHRRKKGAETEFVGVISQREESREESDEEELVVEELDRAWVAEGEK